MYGREILIETNLSAEEFQASYRWEDRNDGVGMAANGSPHQWQVSRNSPVAHVVRILDKRTGAEVAKLNVWIVWAEKIAGGLLSAADPWPVGTLLGQTPDLDPSTVDAFRYSVSQMALTGSRHAWLFRFKISPVDLFLPGDTPNLGGTKSKPTPGSGNTDMVEPTWGSTDTAANKWDVSRQLSVVVRNPNGILRKYLPAVPAWFDNQPISSGDPVVSDHVKVPFPADKAEANDDPTPVLPLLNDEHTNPYVAVSFTNGTGLGHAVGQVTSRDSPSAGILHAGAAQQAGATFALEVNFREFVRLEIWNGVRGSGRFWFPISDSVDWCFALRCKAVANKWVDNGSETRFGHIPLLP